MLYSNASLWNAPPAYLILGIDGYLYCLNYLEETMGERVNCHQLIYEILESLTLQHSALEDLDYYCLALLEEHRFGNLYHHFMPLVEYVQHIGKEIYRGLCEHCAYVNGQLSYRLHEVRTCGVYLQREDLFQRSAQEELKLDESISPRYAHAQAARGVGERSAPIMHYSTV